MGYPSSLTPFYSGPKSPVIGFTKISAGIGIVTIKVSLKAHAWNNYAHCHSCDLSCADTHTHTLHDVVQHIYCNIQKHRTLMILLQASIATGTGSNRSPHQVHAKHAWGIVQSKQLIGLH